ncbi:MAG TPA: sigma-70 family RNA polymerase sigma factor [Acidimicrobiales bacterium]|nr:sigma-70 family RNA polymerase sigma factor [Acidimicrobiales bacterium]
MEPVEFEAWYPEVHRRLVATLTLYAGSVDEATEAVDEALARAFERWGRVKLMESPAGWVATVAMNVLRRRGRRRSLEQAILRRQPPPSHVPAPAGEAWALVRALPERQRLAVVLRFVADLPEARIAEVMGVTRSTVSSTLADALAHLRRAEERGALDAPRSPRA